MALDAHLDLQKGGIEGESKNKGFEKQTQLMSWSWGASNSGSSTHGGGVGGAKASFQDFHFTMQMSKASPKILLYLATGHHMPEALLTLRKSGDKATQQVFLTIKFTHLAISSYQTGGTDDSGLPMEQISLNYTSYDMEYFEQGPDGKVKTAGKGGYDLKLNKPIG